MKSKLRENNRPERDSNSRLLTLYVSALPTELSGHASKSLLKGRSFARTAPLLTNLQQVLCTLRWSCDDSPVQIG